MLCCNIWLTLYLESLNSLHAVLAGCFKNETLGKPQQKKNKKNWHYIKKDNLVPDSPAQRIYPHTLSGKSSSRPLNGTER